MVVLFFHIGRRSPRSSLLAFIPIHRREEGRGGEEERRFCSGSGLCVQRNSAVETTCNDQAIRPFTSKYTHRVRENEAQQSHQRERGGDETPLSY